MFVIADRELQIDPSLIEEAVWARPSAIFDRETDSAPEAPDENVAKPEDTDGEIDLGM